MADHLFVKMMLERLNKLTVSDFSQVIPIAIRETFEAGVAHGVAEGEKHHLSGNQQAQAALRGAMGLMQKAVAELQAAANSEDASEPAKAEPRQEYGNIITAVRSALRRLGASDDGHSIQDVLDIVHKEIGNAVEQRQVRMALKVLAKRNEATRTTRGRYVRGPSLGAASASPSWRQDVSASVN